MLPRISVLEDVLGAHAAALGADLTGYRNHAYRVVNLCAALSSKDPATLEKIALAAAFHDIAIWTSETFDYLKPSRALADQHLAGTSHPEWRAEIDAMIMEHHKILPYRAAHKELVEPFRKADLIDVSQGLIRFGLPRTLLHDLYAQWPGAGFHRKLIKLTLKEFRAHPFCPLPMLKI
jgi:hypothetical protein